MGAEKTSPLAFAVQISIFTKTFVVTAFFFSLNLLCNEVGEVDYSGLAQSQTSVHCFNSESGMQMNSSSDNCEHEIQGQKSSSHQKRLLKKQKVETDKMKAIALGIS